MKNTIFRIAVLCGWAFLVPVSNAQYPNAPRGFGTGTPTRPAVSPYLNLARGGNPGINYYGLVRPQFAAGRAFQTLNDEVSSLEASANNPVFQTGHAASFMTQGKYFMTNGASATGQGMQRGTSQVTPQVATQQSQSTRSASSTAASRGRR